MAFLTDDEIISQPECWERAGELAAEVAELLPAEGEKVAYVGTGTAWYMAQAMAALREQAGQGESDAFTASEMPRHRRYDRLVVLTRSGRTTDINHLLADFRGVVPTLAFTGDPEAESSELADESVDLSFADEGSIVQTRFATTALALTRAWLGHDLARIVLDANAALQEPLSEEFVNADQVTFLGQNWTVGLAHEAALKFRQCAASWSESYPAREYRHGPMAVAEEGRLVWMIGPAPVGLHEEVAETGATFVDHHLDPMGELVIAQRLAVARAMALGKSPDEPRNLRRTVVLAHHGS